MMSVTEIVLLILGVSLIKCRLKGIPLFGVICAFVAVMKRCYSTGIVESQEIWKTITFSVVVTDAMLLGVVELHLFLKFTVKWFQNHIKGTSPYPGQDKFDFRKTEQALELLSLMVIGLAAFSIIMTLILLRPMANNLHAQHHILVGSAYYLHIVLSASSSIVALKILKGNWSRKALIVFVIIFSIGLILLPKVTYWRVIFVLFCCILLLLCCFFMFLYKMTPGAVDRKWNFIQLMDASCDAFLYTALLYWVKLKHKAYRKGVFFNLKVLDFVGGREYYSYHHLFFRSEALYIVVFNLSEFANEDFKDVCTHIQRLQFWMKSICSCIPHFTQILLVGTHREKLDNSCLKILNGHLKRFLSEKYCAKVMENNVDRLAFFPVENTLGNKDTGIQELQSKIMSVAIEQQKRIITEHNIPLLWILIQDLIMKLKRNSDSTFCVSLDEFQRMIMKDFVLRDKCSLSKVMLKYFHKIGLIIYVDKRQDFDLSNWILVCPEKLIDIFISISLKPAESTKYRGSLKYDWKLLQRKGILTKRLLHSYLSKLKKEEEAIIAFLKHYGLIYPLECKATAKYDCDIQPTHFVPSLLPLSANGDAPVWHNNEALFHQLLFRAQKHSNLEFRNGTTVLYRDAGKFWMKPWLSYQLTLIEEEEMIEVTYNSSHKSKEEPSYVLGQVFLMIDGICQSNFPSVEFHCGPACPSETCPGYQDDYFTSLPTAEGNGTRRRHVYDIMLGRQGNQPVYLYCENKCFEDELYEWVPSDK
ncbi:uncharacterized protein LOC141876866 [Acropora palmata]|uniref:uncharacterized protein LOC141876866 n=1 Tax=Acropora palmata TaxID=6131 RepID=UPI003DA11B1A